MTNNAIWHDGEINNDGNNNSGGGLGQRRRIYHQHDGTAPCFVDRVGEATAGQHHDPCWEDANHDGDGVSLWDNKYDYKDNDDGSTTTALPRSSRRRGAITEQGEFFPERMRALSLCQALCAAQDQDATNKEREGEQEGKVPQRGGGSQVHRDRHGKLELG